MFILCLFNITLTRAQIKESDLLKKETTTINVDTSKKNNFKIATNDLKAPVNFSAKDSIVYDANTKQFYLYNKAQIKYDDLELKSNYIEYNTDSSALSAHPLPTDTADSIAKPYFKQGDQEFTFNNLQYNFKSERALVEDAKTKYNDGFILSVQVKRNKDKSIYGIKNIYTTCNLDTPHYGIYTSKIKIIPDVIGISGPARFQVENIPTPLMLPFGIFPLKKGQHAGFILPKYGFEQRRGFGLREFGYYLPINEYLDMKFTADIFSYGSYAARWGTRYTKKYSYSGGFNISYLKNITERDFDVFYDESSSFNVQMNHTIDPKKLNGASFSANVNVGSSNINQFNFRNNINALINNTLTSSINYSKSWKGKPYNLSINASHTQNNTTREFNINLPTVTFNASGITPFSRGNIIGKPKWYQKISLNYSTNLINNLNFYDTAFSLAKLNMGSFNNGMQHNLSSSYNTNILKYFNWNVSANYNEFWYSRSRFKYYNTAASKLDTVTQYGFYAARTYGVSTGITTNVYGLLYLKKGWLRGVRHHLTPRVSINYTPDFGQENYGYYYNTFTDKSLSKRTLSYYEGNAIGVPTRGNSGSISFNVNSNLQAKVFSKKDTLNGGLKLLKIFDNITLNTNYNIVKPTNKWDDISLSFSTNAFDKISISGGGTTSLYAYDYDSNKVSREFNYTVTKKLVRFNGFNMSFGTSFNGKNKNKNKITEQQQINLGTLNQDYLDFDIPWQISVNGTFGLINGLTRNLKADSITYNANFNAEGNISLTDNWKITTKSGYDFRSKMITATEVGITRNLHCWEISFNIIPYGYGRGYVFVLRPKSSLLQDLNVTRRRSFLDN